ncbi:MAG TPA: permease [Rhodospirillaceae bacterium]|nr:permease [Rhodospirillaceae bacterium]
MQIYLPIAEMTVPVESIFLLGTFVGFLSGVFGIGGGFLATPFLIFMGIPPAVAVGTQANQLVAASFSGMMAHWRKGNVDVQMGSVMMAGGLVGSLIGIFVFKMLQVLGQIDFIISILYVLFLGTVGLLMLYESFFSFFKKKTVRSEFNSQKLSPFFMALPYKMRFPRSKLYISALVPAGIGFLGGLMVSIMGIGGGFLLVPAMIYVLGMPTLLVAGTSLFQIIFTSAFAAVMHAVANHTLDMVLAILLISGGVIGARAGASVSRTITGAHARIILAILVLTVCTQLGAQLFIRPAELYSTVVRK